MLSIDGSHGEGGGQIVRSSLALSALTGTPVRIEKIRAGRAKPGLQRQHLVAVQAAAQVCGGTLIGAELGSREITFTPQSPQAGSYNFDIGSAGSTTLVLQTILPILLRAKAPSVVTIRGGTHNGMAPPVEFLQECFLPVLHRCGIDATIDLHRHGFYPAGGGAITATIHPWQNPTPLDLLERGKFLDRHTEILLANLPFHIAERESQAVKHGLHWSQDEVRCRSVDAHGPGNAALARLRFANITSVFTAYGEMRKSAETVGQELVRQVRHYLDTEAPVCEHLADQLLLPLAMGAGGQFRTVKPSLHTQTNATIINTFLGERVSLVETDDAQWLVTVRGCDQ
jgi:RNA 3'-terminal phosphate cyclase (ATP)